MATKIRGGDNWNCTIMGNKEIPKNKINKWKIRLNNFEIKQKIDTFYEDDIYSCLISFDEKFCIKSFLSSAKILCLNELLLF